MSKDTKVSLYMRLGGILCHVDPYENRQCFDKKKSLFDTALDMKIKF